MQKVFSLNSSEMESFKPVLFDTVATLNGSKTLVTLFVRFSSHWGQSGASMGNKVVY